MHEIARLNYIQWDPEFTDKKPFEVHMDLPQEYPPKNFRVDEESYQIIEDIRGREGQFSLDDHGFCVKSHPLSLTNFDRETVEKQYFPQVEEILKAQLGSHVRVHIFDWRVWHICTKMNVL